MKRIIVFLLILSITNSEIYKQSYLSLSKSNTTLINIDKSLKYYDIKIKSNDSISLIVYKKHGEYIFQSKGINFKYETSSHGIPSSIEIKALNNCQIEITWIDYDEEDDNYMIDLVDSIMKLITIISIFVYIYFNTKEKYLRILLMIIFCYELITGNHDTLADRFRKTILRIK